MEMLKHFKEYVAQPFVGVEEAEAGAHCDVYIAICSRVRLVATPHCRQVVFPDLRGDIGFSAYKIIKDMTSNKLITHA